MKTEPVNTCVPSKWLPPANFAYEPLFVFKFAIAIAAADAELINEPLTTPISVNLVFAELLNEFMFVIEVFTLADVVSKLDNLPSCVSFVVFAVDAELIKEPVIVANALF